MAILTGCASVALSGRRRLYLPPAGVAAGRGADGAAGLGAAGAGAGAGGEEGPGAAPPDAVALALPNCHWRFLLLTLRVSTLVNGFDHR